MNITLNDIDDLKNHLAEALRDDLQKIIDPLIAKMQGVETRVGGLEATQTAQGEAVKSLKENQAKALVGFAALCTGVTLLFGQIKEWVMSHVHLHS